MKNHPQSDQILASIAFPVLLIGPDKIVAMVNDACEGFFGTSRRRLEGRTASELFAFSSERMNNVMLSDEADITAQDMELTLSQGKANVDISISAVTENDGWRLITISPRHGERAHIGQHEEDGKQLALGAPAILNHEIKNPLAGIKGAAQLLARNVDSDSRALTNLIVQEVDRIARLLDQMQDLGNSMPGNIAPANIHILIERAIQTLRAANQEMPDIAINYDPSLPDVLIDADAMVQILINLMQNAIHALNGQPDGVITITTRFVMSGAIQDTGHDMRDRRTIKLPLEIVISDNGPGVASHIENELFTPFVTTKREGQGLGLAIVRKLVVQMHSRIFYERDHEQGLTHFRLFLPIASKETAS